MPQPQDRCRNGHKMQGRNLLWHTRYKDGIQSMVRECRICANDRYRANRTAARRNRELAQEAKAS
jgi:hypothetical protein